MKVAISLVLGMLVSTAICANADRVGETAPTALAIPIRPQPENFQSFQGFTFPFTCSTNFDVTDKSSGMAENTLDLKPVSKTKLQVSRHGYVLSAEIDPHNNSLPPGAKPVVILKIIKDNVTLVGHLVAEPGRTAGFEFATALGGDKKETAGLGCHYK